MDERPQGVQRSPIQAIDRAMAMLEVIANAGPDGVPLKALTTAVGLHASTGRTLLSSLVIHGLADQHEGSRRYVLGSRFLELNRLYVSRADLAAVSAPVVRDLWEHTRETVHLSVLQNLQRVDLAVLVSPQLLNINPTPARVTDASVVPLFRTAAGKVLLVGLPADELDAVLAEALSSRTRHGLSRNEVVRQLARIREQGYATNFEEEAAGVCGVAAPVRDHTDRIVAALCVGYPSVRHSDEHDRMLRGSVIEAAGRLSALLGADGDRAAVE
jgi:DNA-binding IclR family transcriptional regulator